MKTHTLLRAALFAALSFTTLTAVQAETDRAAKGLEIATEWDRRDLGFGDTHAKMNMVLENRNADQSTRSMRMKILEVPDSNEGDKSLVIFDTPRDVKGTAFLTWAHILDPDDQWLYLPALKRVKRISSKNKSGPFVGSEFAYEDMSAQELKKYTYLWLRNETCGDLECFVVEQKPTYKNSGYTKMIVWYDSSEYRQQKIDYYDRKDDLLKTLTFADFRQHLNKYWRSYDMRMVNHQTGKKTQLLFTSIDFQTGLKKSEFTKNGIKRAR